MIDTYLIDKYILKNNENYENNNENKNNDNSRNIINIIHLFVLIISIYLYYDCNKKINAEIILSIFFPYSYIIYNFAIALNNKQGFSMKNRCPNQTEISGETVDQVIEKQVQNTNDVIKSFRTETKTQQGGENNTEFSLNSEMYGGDNNSPISDFSITFY